MRRPVGRWEQGLDGLVLILPDNRVAARVFEIGTGLFRGGYGYQTFGVGNGRVYVTQREAKNRAQAELKEIAVQPNCPSALERAQQFFEGTDE